MKKIILLVVGLVFVASLFAGASGEAYMQYPVIGYAGSTDEGGGLVKGYVGIGYWGADYGFHFNYNDTGGAPWTINHMFKKFKLHPMVNLLVGKTAVPLVKQLNPSGFANINIIEPVGPWFDGGCWNFINPENDWMLKLDGNVSGLAWQLYTVDVNTSNMGGYDYADYGARFDYNVAGVELGAGLVMRGVPDSLDGTMDWAFDLGYTAAEMVDLELQLVNNDDGVEDSSDMNLYFVANYVPGFNGIKPYLGYFTYDGADDDLLMQGMENNAMFFGLNFAPTEDSVLKLEYKMYSNEVLDAGTTGDDYLGDTLTLQLGFQF
ncbi:MAG: hypothetical protein U9P73_09750 [Candidatus Cloacimonadota bacterium]|nr:hypothetical protein [Candidatus Cloacimonadota bacterium]